MSGRFNVSWLLSDKTVTVQNSRDDLLTKSTIHKVSGGRQTISNKAHIETDNRVGPGLEYLSIVHDKLMWSRRPSSRGGPWESRHKCGRVVGGELQRQIAPAITAGEPVKRTLLFELSKRFPDSVWHFIRSLPFLVVTFGLSNFAPCARPNRHTQPSQSILHPATICWQPCAHASTADVSPCVHWYVHKCRWS